MRTDILLPLLLACVCGMRPAAASARRPGAAALKRGTRTASTLDPQLASRITALSGLMQLDSHPPHVQAALRAGRLLPFARGARGGSYFLRMDGVGLEIRPQGYSANFHSLPIPVESVAREVFISIEAMRDHLSAAAVAQGRLAQPGWVATLRDIRDR